MSEKNTDKGGDQTTGRQREAQLKKKRRAEQLRRNLMLRKAQSRARRSGDADERNEGLPAATPDNGEDDG